MACYPLSFHTRARVVLTTIKLNLGMSYTLIDMTHILALHTDILRQIPGNYRTWRLLQLTCHDLYDRLGDYHDAIKASFNEGHWWHFVSYNIFVEELIRNMSTLEDDDYYRGMYMDCVWETNKNGSRKLTSYTKVMDWTGDILTLYITYQGHIHRCSIKKNWIDSDHKRIIYIGGIPYSSVTDQSFTVRAICKFIYDELPKLFSVIRTLRPLTIGDLSI